MSMPDCASWEGGGGAVGRESSSVHSKPAVADDDEAVGSQLVDSQS
jgi:hypothetical protein